MLTRAWFSDSHTPPNETLVLYFSVSVFCCRGCFACQGLHSADKATIHAQPKVRAHVISATFPKWNYLRHWKGSNSDGVGYLQGKGLSNPADALLNGNH